MESANNVTLNGSTDSDTYVSFIRMNQVPTHTVVQTISEDQLIAQPLLYNRVSWTSEQDVVVPTKILGELNKLNDDAFITATADGLYDVTVQLSFGNMTIDERLSFALLDSDGELLPNTGQTFVTALSNGTLQSTQLERTTWRVNLVAGEKVYVGISTLANDDLNFDVYSSATHNGSYIELRQLPTHTVVQTISEEAVVVDEQAAAGHVDIGAMRIQWGSINSTVFPTSWDSIDSNDFAITYPVAFGNAPTLTGSLTEGNSQSVNLTFGSVTETGATARLKRIDDILETNSFKVSWMAIGLKP